MAAGSPVREGPWQALSHEAVLPARGVHIGVTHRRTDALVLGLASPTFFYNHGAH